jgi:hypothetical protein
MYPNYSTVANNNKAYQANLANQLGYGAGANFAYGNTGVAGYGATPEAATYKAEPMATGGSVQGAATEGAAFDPNAAAQAAARAAASSAFSTQRDNIFNSAGEAIGQAGNQLGSSILDYLGTLRNQQQGIDRQGVQAELAKRQGSASILDMIGRGIKSGGVMLAGKGATNSSATSALARAYGDLGRRDMSQVGNDYAQSQNDISTAQGNLNTDTSTFQRHVGEEKTTIINNIVSSARQQLAALDASIASASLPDRINIEAEKEKIRQQAVDALSKYDAQLSSGVAGVSPASAEQNRGKAAELATAGVAAESPFQYSTIGPVQFQGSGPFASDLPIFTKRRTA